MCVWCASALRSLLRKTHTQKARRDQKVISYPWQQINYPRQKANGVTSNGKRLNVYEISSIVQRDRGGENDRTLSFSRARTYYMTYQDLDIRRSGESSCTAWQYIGEAITLLPLARAGIQTASASFDEVSCHDVSLHRSLAHLGPPSLLTTPGWEGRMKGGKKGRKREDIAGLLI